MWGIRCCLFVLPVFILSALISQALATKKRPLAEPRTAESGLYCSLCFAPSEMCWGCFSSSTELTIVLLSCRMQYVFAASIRRPDRSAIEDIEPQKCNIGLQSNYRKPFFRRNNVLVATCGIYNEDSDLDLTGRPCCCDFCGQRDSFDQLCEISKRICTTVAECVQRHHGTCVDDGKGKGVEKFHIFWTIAVVSITVAPFLVPVIALVAAGDIVLGLAG